jgi:Zn-dependent peptidase ImmA (M78 family)
MNDVRSTFGERLQLARKMAGLSYQGLADKLHGLVTKQALHKYELGSMMPDSEKLIELANALDVTVNFFFRQDPVKVELEHVEFRKTLKLPVKERDAILGRITDEMGRYLEAERLMGSSKKFTNPLPKDQVTDPEQAEELAELVRKRWKLGVDGISSVYETLEQQAIKVMECHASSTFDGLNARVDDHMVIVMNDEKEVVRKRFTAAHELAHALLAIPDDLDHRTKEQICHRFAGAFLWPREQFIDRVGPKRARFMLDELIEWKQRWGMSFKAIIRRSYDLGIINDATYKRALINYNVAGFSKGEPEDYKVPERTVRFEQLVLSGLAQDILSLNQAADLMNMKMGDFRKKYSEVV